MILSQQEQKTTPQVTTLDIFLIIDKHQAIPYSIAMTKLNTPLLSLRASGPLGKTLSYDNRAGTPRVRKMPKPKDAYTLPQVYHRYDFCPIDNHLSGCGIIPV